MKLGDDGGDGGEHERLEREEPDAGEQHPLHDQQQLQHQHQRGHRVMSCEPISQWSGGGSCHWKRKVESSASVGQHEGGAQQIRHAEQAQLGVGGFDQHHRRGQEQQLWPAEPASPRPSAPASQRRRKPTGRRC